MTFRWHWGHSIAATYAAFAIGTSGVVAFAMRQRVDLVSDDYYDQAIALDAERAAVANAAALGASFGVDVSSDGRQVTVRWPAGSAPEGRLRLYRASDATADRAVDIAAGAASRQQVSLEGLAPGRWLLQIDWRAGGRRFYAEREVVAR